MSTTKNTPGHGRQWDERARRNARRYAGWRFETADGGWADALDEPADPPAAGPIGFRAQRKADLRRWGL